jgi:hypothetical protein
MMKNFIKIKLNEALNVIDESNIITIEKISPNADEITKTMVYPVVNSLFRGINKLKRNEYDKLTTDEKTAILNVFPDIIDKKTKEFRKDYAQADSYLTPNEFTNIYNVKTLNNKNIKVSLGFCFDKKTSEIAYFDSGNKTIVLNIANLSINNLNQLQSTIRHELVHSADPKVTNKKIRKNIDDKSDEYFKLPYEFDSFTHEFVTTISNNLKLIDDEELKDSIVKNLWLIISDIKNEWSPKLLYKEFKDNAVIRLFSENGLTSKNINALKTNFFQFLLAANKWSTKPTLFDKFVSRLVRYVPYKV